MRRIEIFVVLFLVVSSSCEVVSAQRLSALSPQKVESLNKLRDSRAVNMFYNSLDLFHPAQSLTLVMARFPDVAKGLIDSPFGDAAISLIQLVDSKLNSSSSLPERSSSYLGRYARILNESKSFEQWKEITRDAVRSNPSLEWSGRSSVAALLEVDASLQGNTPSWMFYLDDLSLVWFIMMCVSAIAGAGIIFLWGSVMLSRGVFRVHSAVFLLSMAGVVAYAGVVSSQLVGINTMFKGLYTFIYNSMLFPLVKKTTDTVAGLNMATNLLSSSSSSSSSSSARFQGYSQLGQMQENLCATAWPQSSSYINNTDPVTGVSMRVGESYMEPDSTKPMAIYLRYKNDGPMSSWHPIARWNAARLPREKQVPNPSYCCTALSSCVDETGVKPSYRQCPGYWMYNFGRTDRCSCLEVMQQLGFEIESRDETNCFFDLRDNYLTVIESMFNEDINSMTTRVTSESAIGGCAGAYHAGGAVIVNSVGTLVVMSPYSTSTFSDKTVTPFSKEIYAQFGSTSATQQPGISWTIKSCFSGPYTLDFRYSANSNVNVMVYVDSLAGVAKTLPATAGRMMRNAFVLDAVDFDAGDHTVKVVKLASQSSDLLAIHRLQICSESLSTPSGCLLHKVQNPVYCYTTSASVAMNTVLDGVGLEGTSDIYFSSDDALSACSARSDCAGVLTETSTSASSTYRLRKGTTTSDTSKQVLVKTAC